MLGEYLQLNQSGHFINMPQHSMVREKPMDYLLIWVLKGRGYGETEGQRWEVGPGHLLSFLPGKPQAYGSDKEQPWDILWVHFQGKLARRFVDVIRRGDGGLVDIGLDDALRDRWIELAIVHGAGGPSAATRCNTALYGLLGMIAHRRQSGTVRAAEESRLDVYRLQAFIHHHVAASITLESLARQVHLSPTHFSRLFRRQFAVSPMAYVIQKRMALAASMLAETARPLKEICQAVGYDDAYYFSRLFKKQMGVSPSAYRLARRRPILSSTPGRR